jgi:hypothetical protein
MMKIALIHYAEGKGCLIKNGISNYVAIRHPREEHKVLILTRDEAER